jgi:DNA-binding MarR family transcriptional regulator
MEVRELPLLWSKIHNSLMKNSDSTRSLDLTPQGNLGEGGLHNLLGYQLAQATIVTDADFKHRCGEPFDLRPVEFTILQLIRENTGVTSTRLAQALAVTKPGITVWLDRLVKRGLVVRARSDTDGRAQLLQLTQAGQEIVANALKALQEANTVTLQDLSEGEKQILVELLRKVAHGRALRRKHTASQSQDFRQIV